MKKMAFGLTIIIATMLFSCATDPSNNTENSPIKANLREKIKIANPKEAMAKIDKKSADFVRTATAIDQNINALNEVEIELLKEFDLK